MRRQGFQLSRLTICHLDFLQGLYDDGFIDERALTELAHEGLKGIPKEAQRVLYPMTEEVVGLVANHYRSGKKKIAIYMDGKGQRRVAADFE
ncbi:MAG TPA: hypothetical protein VJA47_01880 [archaeon]|nr:hypothetical protein [archaeon]